MHLQRCATLQCISKLLICATIQCILKALRGATLQCMYIVQWIYRKVHPSNIEMCWDAELIFRKVYTSPAQVSVFMQSQLFHFAQNWQREGAGSGAFCCQFHKAFVSQHNEQTYPTSFWYIQKFMKYIFRCIMLYLLRHIMKYRFRYILRYIFTQLPHPSSNEVVIHLHSSPSLMTIPDLKITNTPAHNHHRSTLLWNTNTNTNTNKNTAYYHPWS